MAYVAEAAIGAGQTAIANAWTDVASGTLTSTKAFDVFQVQISAYNNSAVKTDNLEVRVLMSTGTNFDEGPTQSIVIKPDAGQVAAPKSLILSMFYKYKVQVQSSGGTDTYDITGSFVKEYQT